MKLNLIRTQGIQDGLNTKSERPIKCNMTALYETDGGGYIKINPDSKLSEWKVCKIIVGEWIKGEYYITLNDSTTFTGAYPFTDLLLWLRVKNMANIMAWIGGILSSILTIKEIFFL